MTFAPPESPLPRVSRVTAPDGVNLLVREWGDPAGQPVVFIHGYCQSGLCWERQVQDPALAHLRLITFDMRGHGASDKPLDPAFYQEDARWAGDLRAILATLDGRRPILAGWSYGGRVICDYLAAEGGDGIAGLMLVAAVASVQRAHYGTCNRLMFEMTSTDLGIAIPATRSFLRKCYAVQPDTETYETALAFNMMVPPQVRTGMAGRTPNFDAPLMAYQGPVVVVHGEQDQVIAPAMSHHILTLMPQARLELWPGIGHTPFQEQPERFNALLADMAAARTS